MISDLFMSIINVGTSDNSINTLHPPQCDMLLEDENISARTLADPEGVGVQLFCMCRTSNYNQQLSTSVCQLKFLIYVFLISRFT